MPRVVIVVEGGEVKQVLADDDIEFTVLDYDVINCEDLVGLTTLLKTTKEFSRCKRADLDSDVRVYLDKAKRRLISLTE